MRRRTLVIILATFTLIAATVGCSANDTGHDKESVKDSAANQTAESEHAKSDQPKTPEKNTTDQETSTPPDKATVFSQRALALDGMSEDDIETLTSTISKLNLRLESEFMFNDLEKRLSDPDSYSWNFLDQTGEIVIGYSFDEEAMNKKKELNLTEEEFEKQYGEEVIYNNEYDADRICEILNTLKNTVQDENLIHDFDNGIEYLQKAKNTHDVQYFLDFYRLFHDMDYYLLRYGHEDFSMQVRDTSTVDLFYGMLSCYN